MTSIETKANSQFIRKIYFNALFANIIAVLGGTINVFFDSILVGQRLGEVGLSMVNQSLPIYMILCTIGSLFASGASFLASFALGKKDEKESQRIFHATLLTSALLALAFCLLGIIFIKPVTSLLATAETFDGVSTYVRITLTGGVFKVLLYVPFFFLRIEGKHKRGAVAMFIMTGLNIILDFLFLFKYDLGIAGAAWASVIATAVACILCFVFLFTDHPNFHFGLALYKKEDWKDIVRYGSPMALNNILSSARIFALNLILRSVGGSSLLSVFAVVNNVNEFSICIQNGVPQTATAMTGVFFGEKDFGSVKALLKTQLNAGIILSVCFSLIITALSGKIGLMFGFTGDCRIAVICFAVSLLVATANNVLSYYFNAIGEISMANSVTICRAFVFVVLFTFLFKGLENWIWLFYPAAEIFTFLFFLFIGLFYADRRKLTRFYMLDESFEKNGTVISFSVPCDNEKISAAGERANDFCMDNGFNTKKSMAISLAIEELLVIISQKSLKGEGTMDVRLLKSGEEGIIRIRSGGKRYNPIEQTDDSLDYMGVRMIAKMAKKIEYLSTLGVNTLIITI